MNTIYILLYIIGYVVAYILLRHLIRQEQGSKYSWGNVVSIIATSLCSWGIIIVILLIIGIIEGVDYVSSKEPPKWL